MGSSRRCACTCWSRSLPYRWVWQDERSGSHLDSRGNGATNYFHLEGRYCDIASSSVIIAKWFAFVLLILSQLCRYCCSQSNSREIQLCAYIFAKCRPYRTYFVSFRRSLCRKGHCWSRPRWTPCNFRRQEPHQTSSQQRGNFQGIVIASFIVRPRMILFLAFKWNWSHAALARIFAQVHYVRQTECFPQAAASRQRHGIFHVFTVYDHGWFEFRLRSFTANYVASPWRQAAFQLQSAILSRLSAWPKQTLECIYAISFVTMTSTWYVIFLNPVKILIHSSGCPSLVAIIHFNAKVLGHA